MNININSADDSLDAWRSASPNFECSRARLSFPPVGAMLFVSGQPADLDHALVIDVDR